MPNILGPVEMERKLAEMIVDCQRWAFINDEVSEMQRMIPHLEAARDLAVRAGAHFDYLRSGVWSVSEQRYKYDKPFKG